MQSPLIRAVIFDMDGVLIDSEPVWQQAEFEVLTRFGLPVTFADMNQTTGLRIDELVNFWYQRFPDLNFDRQAMAQFIVQRVVDYIEQDGVAMAGVVTALTACRAAGLAVGLATSSSQLIMDAVLNKLAIRPLFDVTQSAEKLPFGKPHPEVYLQCAKQLGIHPNQCLAVEDSFNGLIAARAASMQTLVIPAPEHQAEARWAAAHHQAQSLTAMAQVLAHYQLSAKQ
ncbi:hexitol phosphatase HxpB [Shewanella avicenniae]|uniref:Hexitol phosphatase HxpB n=1 Tax=Shewanella avicenniae TaxID=2814294 RepID=A0ABX7QRE1_9GAMM|nr:hexitol phosphatase HxpB [Shewanella avicenniae]QSX34021.1 hexitol phosphatase HxpB [Shewanella avicenniae]